MKRKIKAWIRDQQGSSIVLAGLMMVGLLGVSALVVDMGILYVTKTHLQKTANAAALSGAQELTQTETNVRNVVSDVVQFHHETSSHTGTTVVMERSVNVQLNKEVPLTFAKVLGMERASVAAKATAEIQVMGSAVGAAPVGIDESIQLVYNTEYRLKVDENEVNTGNFGILALGGTGGNTYEDNFKYGYNNELKVGDVIDTQTGNIVDKTRVSVQLRIDQCPYPLGDTSHRDCPRIIMVPVYRPYQYNGNQIQHVQITGFSYFYIKNPVDMKDKTVTGIFIKRADTGFVQPGAVNRGAFAIKLTE